MLLSFNLVCKRVQFSHSIFFLSHLSLLDHIHDYSWAAASELWFLWSSLEKKKFYFPSLVIFLYLQISFLVLTCLMLKVCVRLLYVVLVICSFYLPAFSGYHESLQWKSLGTFLLWNFGNICPLQFTHKIYYLF